MPLRVLLVDDSPDARVLVREILRVRGGFDVVAEAADGEQAVAAAAAHQPDVVVLDLAGVAGSEVLSRLRREAPRSSVVVLTSGRRFRVGGEVRGYTADGDAELLVELLAELSGGGQKAIGARLERDARSASEARRLVRRQCEDWRCAAVADDAELVVSELVGNALKHARSDCGVVLRLCDTALRIEVSDGGAGTPDPVVASEEDESGRGLLLVAALAHAWGVASAPDGGKTVWAELVLPE